MKNAKLLWIAAAILLGIVAISYITNTPLTSVGAKKPVGEVAAAPPKAPEPKRPADGNIVAAGRVEPASEETTIGAEFEGRLARVYFKEGDKVRRGALVAELVNDDFRARVALAKATVGEKEAALARLKNGSRQEEQRQAQAILREEQARLSTARTELNRRRPLVEAGAVSKSEFELALREETTAAARVQAATERLALIKNETRSEDIQRAEADLAAAVARRDEAQAQLAKTYIHAPIAGTIIHRWRKTGESVSAGTISPILSIGDISRLRVRVDVDETDVARIRIGQAAYVTADAYPGKKFTGKVVSIGQALGRKQVRTDEPTERVDKKILETLVELDEGQSLPVGLRVDAFIQP